MMTSFKVKTFWLPLVSFWAFLSILYLNNPKGFPFLLLVYVSCSAYLVRHIISVVNDSGQSISSVTKASQLYVAFCSLVVSSFIAIIGSFLGLTWNPWFCFFCLICLVIDLFFRGLGSYSNDQISRFSNERSLTRSNAELIRRDYAETLAAFLSSFPESRELSTEVKRILRILPYSSFFRCDLASSLLVEIKKEDQPEILAQLLKKVI